jgi:ubiquinone/menaquinone biosynthesis C-methylase UbiE
MNSVGSIGTRRWRLIYPAFGSLWQAVFRTRPGALGNKTRNMTGPEKRAVQEGYDRVAKSCLLARPHDGEDVALIAEVLHELPNHSRVLDAGCGSGIPVARQLLEAGHDVAGLDFSSGQLSLARSNLAK